MLKNKKIGLFITGGIASYKMAELSRMLIKKGAEVRVVMSEGAQAFITPLTMQVSTKHHVIVNTFDEYDPTSVQHIEMADWMDVAIVSPATANIISKMATGIGDDVVSTILLAKHCPTLVVPAMNTNMYENPAIQRNLKQLVLDGVTVMEPEVGYLAEGYEGKGRLPDLDDIVSVLETLVARNTLPQVLKDKKVVVTAGGTRERIDPVRYITNDSSGKMGYAIAQAAQWYGGNVELVSTSKTLSVPTGVNITYVESALEMKDAVESHFEEADYVVMAAAVSDYRVKKQATQKMKRSGKSGLEMTIELVENPDILKSLGEKKSTQTLIGFAAETQNILTYAREKLERKNADWIIANDVSQEGSGFNVDTNQVTILSRGGREIQLDQMSKLRTAQLIWENITRESE